MKKLLLLAPALSLFSFISTKAQTNIFLMGDFVEVGTYTDGAFGTSISAPAGYHPITSCVGGGTTLGFVSDPDMDGWAVSAVGRSPYMGDYFVPGTPFEGFEIQINGVKKRNWASGMGVDEMPATSTSSVVTPTQSTGIWEGNYGSLGITQKTVLKKDKLYFVIYVDLVNTGSTTLNNIYYHRGLDPDNEQPWAACSHATINRIVYQPNALSKNCLVTADGVKYGTYAYLGLGTKDCRARCMNIPGWHPGNLANLYLGNGTESGNQTTVGWSTPSATGADEAIGIVFNLGNLAPGQKTSLAFTYILRQADLDSALGETAPKFESAGSPYSPYTTFRLCPGKKVNLKVINGGQYQWIWTTPAAPSYLAAIGSSTLILPGGTIPAVTGTTVYPLGAVYGDSVEVTVWGPKTYYATGISNCDTQRLIFYVDTISFSVPPTVVTPIRYCEGATPSVLTAGTAAGASLSWYSSPSGGLPGSAPTPSTAFPAGATTDFDTTSYWVSQVNAAGCETPRARIQVIVTRKPTAPADTDLIYCKDVETKMLNAGGVNLKWYDAATAGMKYPSTPTPSASKAGTVSYFVSQTVNGCESDRSDLRVETIEAIASFDKTEDSLCGNELLTLTNTSTTSSLSGYNSSWSFGDGASTTDSNTFHRYEDKRGTYTIRLIVSTKINGCLDTAIQLVEVFKVPSISMAKSESKICQGNAVDFQGFATPGFNGLSWDFGDGDPAFNTLQVRHAFTKAGPALVTLQGFYPACPAVSVSAPVDVVALPNVDLGRDTGFCPGNIALTLRNHNAISVDKYTWNTGDTTPTIQVRNAGQYSVKAQNWECVSADSITVSKACYLDVPNAFNPGSGNDEDRYFLPRELLSKSVVTFNMQIFDRWGQLIFETDKVNGRGWDGNHKGQAMPFGVYVYQIRVSFANGVSENYNGNLTLLR